MANSEAAAAVREDRLWQRHMDMAQIGATPKGGVNRPALSPEDAEARRLLVGWAKARGFTTYVDEIGNLFIRRPGRRADVPPVLTGSHMDSQPTGGRFDGIYGVLAGFEVLEALENAGIATERPIEAVAWTNEEGSRFQPGTMGSAVFAGAKKAADLLGIADKAGTKLGDALARTLAATPDVQPRPTAFSVAAYIEAHIEQGPLLERAGTTIGVVSAIQGVRWFSAEVIGDEAHAGTMPRAGRRDALLAALRVVQRLSQEFADAADTIRFTVGRFEVFPGSPNTVPGRVFFTVDLRHPDRDTLQRLGDRIAPLAAEAAGPCTVQVTETIHSRPVQFDPAVTGRIAAAAGRLGLRHMPIVSGAGHDAVYLAKLCPTGMIFVPCAKGISHNEAESATPADLAAGTRVLAEVLVELANG